MINLYNDKMILTADNSRKGGKLYSVFLQPNTG